MRALALTVVGSFLVACAGPAAAPSPTATIAAVRTATPAAPATQAPAAPAATLDPKAQASRPAFLTIALTDVRTGERFTLGGFQGKVVLGIAMAVW